MYGRLWLSLLVSAATTCTFPAVAGNSNTDYSFIVDQVGDNCQQFGEAYQEIGSFETTNFHVNLCAIGDRYFYMGTAKNKSLKSNFIPAYPTDQLHTYQADNGNNSYIVKIKPTQGVLIIQRNNKTILVETAFTEKCPKLGYHSQVQFLPEFNYSKDRVALISDRYYWGLNQIYTSSSNLPNQLQVIDSSPSKVFSSVPNQLSSFSDCF